MIDLSLNLRDLFGSYTYAFNTCGVMLLVGAALAFLLKAPKLH